MLKFSIRGSKAYNHAPLTAAPGGWLFTACPANAPDFSAAAAARERADAAADRAVVALVMERRHEAERTDANESAAKGKRQILVKTWRVDGMPLSWHPHQ